MRAHAPGDYEVVLLEQNLEMLVAAVTAELGVAMPDKRDLEARDGVLNRLAFGADGQRQAVQARVSSFVRIVRFAASKLG